MLTKGASRVMNDSGSVQRSCGKLQRNRNQRMKNEEWRMKNEDDDEDESGGEGRGEERAKQREKERDEEAHWKKQNADTDPKHLCSCANHSRDHNRLLVRAGAFKAQAGSSTHKRTCSTVRLFGPCFKTGRTETKKKTRARGDTCTSRERRHPRVPLERERLQGLSMPASLGVPLEFNRSPFFWPEGPCFATNEDCSSNASLSISSFACDSGAVDVTPAMPRPWTTNWLKWTDETEVVGRSSHSSTTQRQGRKKGEGVEEEVKRRDEKGNRWWKSCVFKTQKTP